jgi:hypothetical protein
LHVLADRLLPHILTTNPGIEFQEIVDGRAVPRLLDWSYSQVGLLNEVREVSPWTVVIGALIFITLWMTIISVLNPTFRPLSRRLGDIPVPKPVTNVEDDTSEPAIVTQHESEAGITESPPIVAGNTRANQAHITIDRIHLEQALRLLLAAGLPVLAVGFVTGAFGNEPIVGRGHPTRLAQNLIGLVKYLALGIGIFVGFSQSGIAGRFGILHQAYQSDEAAIPSQRGTKASACFGAALKGCFFGAVLWALQRCAMGAPDRGMLDRFQALGTFSLAYYFLVARPYIASAAMVWLSAGTMIYLLGKPGLRMGSRVVLACIPLICAVVLVNLKRPFTPEAMAASYDTTDSVLAATRPFDQKRPTASVPSGRGAATEFARRVPVNVIADHKPASCNDMIAFDPKGLFEVEIDDITDDGVITDHAKCKDVQAFLDKRMYRSALSWVATKYLFNDANIRFDQTAEIRYGLDDLEKSPHMFNMGDTMRAIFFLCSASQQNLALLNEYADESKFVHPTRESQRMMGDLYTRFGEVKTALNWYRMADMPHSFIHQVTSERPLYHAGTVTGKLTWNGAPLAGVQVGASPQRLNGLPRDLQPVVLHYDEELAGIVPEHNPLFSQFHPRPFHLRWICGGATTGPDGSFTIEHLTEGEYFLVCSLPTGVKLSVPTDTKLTIQHIPPAFTLSYDYPKQDLGVVAFKYQR